MASVAGGSAGGAMLRSSQSSQGAEPSGLKEDTLDNSKKISPIG